MKRAILIAAAPTLAIAGGVGFAVQMVRYLRNAPEIAAHIADETEAHIDAVIAAGEKLVKDADSH